MEESSGDEQEKGRGKEEEEKVVYVTKSKASPAALNRKSSVASLKHKESVASLKHKASAASVKSSPLKPRSLTGSLKPKSTAMQPPDVDKEKEGEEGEEKLALRTRASRKRLAEVVDTSVDGEGEVWMRMRTRSG